MNDTCHEKPTLPDNAAQAAQDAPLGIETAERIQSRQAISGPSEGTCTVENLSNETWTPANHRLIIVIFALTLAILLVGFDATVVGTIIPTLSENFGGFDDVGWYGSAFFLSACSCQCLFGKLHDIFPIKKTFLSAIFIFEVGSLLSGIAPNSAMFIAGRAVTGIGFAGIVSGGLNILAITVPLNKRPMCNGLVGAFEMLAQAVGPVFAGAVATKWSWRWCFYLNLPAGAVVIVLITVFLSLDKEIESPQRPLRERIMQLDIIGCAVLVPAIVCLLISLQLGGAKYPWSNSKVVAFLTTSFILSSMFVYIEIRRGDLAMLPPKIFKERTVLFAVLFGFCAASALSTLDIYLPIWFQTVKGVSALESGTMLLPLIIALLIGSLFVGPAVSFIGYYNPFMIAGCLFMSVGTGLLTTISSSTSPAKWIGYQILVGLGAGMSYQQPFNAVQATLRPEHISVGISSVIFSQTLGSTLFISISQNVLVQKFGELVELTSGNQNISVSSVIATASTLGSLANSTAEITTFNESLTTTFFIPVGLSASLIVGALGVKWVSIQAKNPTPS